MVSEKNDNVEHPSVDIVDKMEKSPEEPAKITMALVKEYLKTAVVEPLMILFMFAFAGRSITSQSLFKDKACLVELGYNSSICSNLNDYGDIENEVQIIANNYHLGHSLITMIPSIVANIFLSSWSDKYGRKIPLLIALFGVILENVGMIWNLVNFHMPIYYMLLPAIPSGCFGGIMVIMTASISYITDVSDVKTRVLRFALFEVAFIFAAPMGTAVCGVIYQHSGYLAVFLTSLGCVVACPILILLRMKEPNKKKLSDFKVAMASLFSLENVKGNIRTCTKDRGGTTRREIWFIVLAMCFTVLSTMGTHSIEYFFVSKMYNWSNYTYSLVSMICSIGKGLGILIAVPILTNKLKVSDITLSLVGNVSSIALAFFKSLAFEDWMFLNANLLGAVGGLSGIGTKARLSKLVPREEIGKVFSVLTLCESLTPVIGTTGFSQIYNMSVSFFPGLAFLVSGCLLTIPTAVFIWITGLADKAPFETAKKKPAQELQIKTESDTKI